MKVRRDLAARLYQYPPPSPPDRFRFISALFTILDVTPTRALLLRPAAQGFMGGSKTLGK